MVTWLMRRAIGAFERKWSYDARCLYDILEASPRAAQLFWGVASPGSTAATFRSRPGRQRASRPGRAAISSVLQITASGSPACLESTDAETRGRPPTIHQEKRHRHRLRPNRRTSQRALNVLWRKESWKASRAPGNRRVRVQETMAR
jgi:hypothetical protein